MSFPDKPPEPKFKWPRKWEEFIWDLVEWVKARQPIPSEVDFVRSEGSDGVRFRLNSKSVAAVVAGANIHRLQMEDASAAGVPMVRVRLGYIAGRIADTSMNDPFDDPPYIETLASTAGTQHVYAQVTVGYDMTTGAWTSSDCWIDHAATVPTASPATNIYIDLGAATVAARTSGGGYEVAQIQNPQPVTGDQWVARTGNDTTYVDAHGNV